MPMPPLDVYNRFASEDVALVLRLLPRSVDA
jgi:hypothetical protein